MHMKLSKSLLQAMFIGLTGGVVATSCTAVETIEEIEEEIFTEKVNEERGEGTCNPDWLNCPACGMG